MGTMGGGGYFDGYHYPVGATGPIYVPAASPSYYPQVNPICQIDEEIRIWSSLHHDVCPGACEYTGMIPRDERYKRHVVDLLTRQSTIYFPTHGTTNFSLPNSEHGLQREGDLLSPHHQST